MFVWGPCLFRCLGSCIEGGSFPLSCHPPFCPCWAPRAVDNGLSRRYVLRKGARYCCRGYGCLELLDWELRVFECLGSVWEHCAKWVCNDKCVYIYIYICIYIYIYIYCILCLYIYTPYIYREREIICIYIYIYTQNTLDSCPTLNSVHEPGAAMGWSP